jgi:membrane protein implicated in regulation of membrane protease activity
MDLSASTLWWIAAGVLVAVELATGTFYLLMLAVGAVAGALAAHATMSSTLQTVAAALVGGGATALWHLRRSRHPVAPAADVNRDVHLDIGETVQVPGWEADGSARVQYRGAAWSVRWAGSGAPSPGEHVIVGMSGNQLRVARPT